MNNHKDAGRNIARIDYDCLNNPVRIQFTNGNVTKYIYSTIGEKLRVVYQTAVPNITVAIGSSRVKAVSAHSAAPAARGTRSFSLSPSA